MNAVRLAFAMRSAEGCQMGLSIVLEWFVPTFDGHVPSRVVAAPPESSWDSDPDKVAN